MTFRECIQREDAAFQRQMTDLMVSLAKGKESNIRLLLIDLGWTPPDTTHAKCGKVFLTNKAQEGVEYNKIAYYRCVGGEKFIDRLEKSGSKIVGVVFEDNNVGFILSNEDTANTVTWQKFD